MASNNLIINIRKATKKDAQLIADAIMEAVGEEISVGFAGSPERLPLVKQVFTELAEAEESQYSYTNTLVAEAQDGNVAGLVISYDGARLHTLRENFVKVANRVLGYNMKSEEFTDETSPDEIYLDTLCVFAPYRKQGIGGMLIEAAVENNRMHSKPVGLLVDKYNERARLLYEKHGFKFAGERPFAGVMMDHLVR